MGHSGDNAPDAGYSTFGRLLVDNTYLRPYGR
jgi:hypothetical protein